MTLIDAGMPGRDAFNQLKQALKEEGITLQDLDQLVMTHMHTDHAGGVPFIQREANLPIYVHHKAQETIEGGKERFERDIAFYNAFSIETGAAPHFQRRGRFRDEPWTNVHYLKEGDVLDAGDRSWNITYAPGHSQTDLCLWDPLTGEAVVGDHLLKHISSNAFIEPPGIEEKDRPKPLIQYRSSMNRSKELPWKTLFPGHGEPFRDHKVLIEQRFKEMEERCHSIRQAIGNGQDTVYKISVTLFPWLKEAALFLGISEIQGHMDLMLQRGEITYKSINQVKHYELI